jgi:outer membrane lipoprotein carrier protein
MAAIQIGCSALLLAMATAPAPKAPKPDPAAELVAKVQKHYEKLQDFSAEFTQIYTRVALSRTSESRGKLMLKKPGMMRWEYAKPEPKLWIADGSQLYIYDPEFEQVVVDKSFNTNRLSESISFLWGEGRLTDAFDAKTGAPAKDGSPVLELTPKRDATYARLVLVLDPKSGHVMESIIYETSGNTNHFKFGKPTINGGLKADLFQFVPPEGTEVIER